MNQELPGVQTGFRKGRGTRDQIDNICWIIGKAKSFRKTSISASLTTLKPLTIWIRTNYRKLLKRWEYQTTLPALWKTCIQVKKQQLKWDTEEQTGLKIEKGVYHDCIFSPCLFKLYAEYMMWNARLDKSQVGIKTARRNINNLRYADNTTLMA